MLDEQPLFDFSKISKDLIESNSHVDWSAFNNLLPWKQKPSGVAGQDPESAALRDLPDMDYQQKRTGNGHNGK